MIINNIKNSIANMLKTLYPSYEVNDETLKQGLIEPCFFVKLIDQNTNKEIKNRFNFNTMFSIQYFLDENTENLFEQYIDMAEILYEKLSLFIDLSGGYLRGSNMRHEIQDNILTFFVDVNIKTQIVQSDDVLMNTLDKLNNHVKD
jgi:hypothetical protein